MPVLRIRNAANTGWITLGGASEDYPAFWKANLRIEPGTTAAHQVVITADELCLTDSSGVKALLTSVDTGDISVANAWPTGNLDTGSEAVSTMYYLWVIMNPTTGDVDGLFSTSSSSPTMPSGYTFKRLVGEVYNDSSWNLVDQIRENDKVYFADAQQVYDSQTLTTSFVQYSYPASVPDEATEIEFVLFDEAGAGNFQVVRPGNAAKYERETNRADSAGGGYGGLGATAYRTEYMTMITRQNGSCWARANSAASAGTQSFYIWAYTLAR